jgi:hypothetical protein
MSGPDRDNFFDSGIFDRLFSDFQPAKPLWPLYGRLAVWLVLALGLVAVGISTHRADLPQKLGSASYLLELMTFIAMGTGAAVLALRAAIPGREPGLGELALLSMVAMVAIALISSEPSPEGVSLAQFVREGVPCLVFTGIFATLPWLSLFWAVRRGAPIAVGSAGTLTGVAAFSFALAIGRLRCPIQYSPHFLIWHMLPALLGVLLSFFAGAAWLGRHRPRWAARTR